MNLLRKPFTTGRKSDMMSRKGFLVSSMKVNFPRLTRTAAIQLIVALLWHELVYLGARWIAGGWVHYDLTTAFDRKIPLVPWTIVIYFGCYLFWVVNYYLCATLDTQERNRFFFADLLAKGVCFALFLVLPTTNVRPEIVGNGIFDHLMRFLYSVDAADNLFPSMHCLTSWLCWIGVRKRKDISRLYRRVSLEIAILVCISTLTTYQHVIADVIAGVLIAEASYFIAGKKRTSQNRKCCDCN